MARRQRRKGSEVSRVEYWRGVVGRWRKSGRRVPEFCRKEAINISSFYRWRRIIEAGPTDGLRRKKPGKGRRSPSLPPFLPVQVVGGGTSPHPVIEVEFAQHHIIRVYREVDIHEIVRMVSALEAVPCS